MKLHDFPRYPLTFGPSPVHRLDRLTSGVILVAKTDAAHQALSAQFADRSLSRTYLALVWGRPNPSAFGAWP